MKRLLGIIGMAAIAFLLIGGAFAAQRSGKQVTPGKIYWPEKEGVPHALVGHGEMRDSCVPPSPFDLPTRLPVVC